MKRFLAIALTAMFVLGLAASAFADVTVGGDVRYRGESRNNTADFDDKKGDHLTKYDLRTQIQVTGKVSDKTTGKIIWESQHDGGTSSADASGNYANGNGQNGFSSGGVVEGWINHDMGMIGIKVGHMPLALGNKLFFDHTVGGDDAIVIYADPSDKVHIGALTAKFVEGSTTNNNDADAYVILGVFKGIGSADLTYVKDRQGSPWMYANDGQTIVVAGSGTRGTFAGGIDLWNLGLRAEIPAGPVNIKANLEYQTGTGHGLYNGGSYYGCANNNTSGKKDCKFKGNAFLLSGDAKVGGVNVGAEFGRGSGDKDIYDDDSAHKSDSSVKTFIVSHSAGVKYYTFVYDTRTTGAAGVTGGGIANTTYVQLRGNGKISDAMSLGASYTFLKATEKVALASSPAQEQDSSGSGTKNKLSNDLGSEIDFDFSYMLDKGLKYWIEGGYFMPGAAYDRQDTASTDPYAKKDADNAYALRHGIQLSF